MTEQQATDVEMEGTVTIAGKTHKVADLSENARTQILNIQITDEEILRLQRQLAIVQTARATYVSVLQRELADKG